MFRIACVLVFARLAQPIRGDFRLQILHNNDLHARFAETDTYGASCPDNFKIQNKCYGGFARMKQAADEAISAAKRDHVPSIFLNGGDTFQGTPYYTIYKWQIAAQLIDMLQFDVMALGNHEFDDGIDNLVNYLKNIRTPVVCANINVTSEKRLDLPILTPSKILNVEGRKIGVIGYLLPDATEISMTENLQIFPEIPRIRSEARRLKADGIKIIIALGHSGFQLDKKIAEQIEEISVVVGAHSHSLLHTPKDRPPSTEPVVSEYPTIVTQPSGKIVPVVQAYAFSKYLGRLIVDFDENGNVKNATGNTQLLDYRVKKEPTLDKEVTTWEKILHERIRVIKGYTRTAMIKPNFKDGRLESNLANFITDSFVDVGVQLSQESKLSTWTRAPIGFYQNGGIRCEIDNKKNDGAMTLEDLMTVLPFENKLVEVALRGSTIMKILEHSVSFYDSAEDNIRVSYYMHFSGLRVVYDFAKPKNERVKSVSVLCTECSIPAFEPLKSDQVYRAIMTDFLADGGDKFDMIKNERIGFTKIGLVELDVVIRYLENRKIIYPILDNRTTVVGFTLNQKTSSASITTSTTLFCIIVLVHKLRILIV